MTKPDELLLGCWLIGHSFRAQASFQQAHGLVLVKHPEPHQPGTVGSCEASQR
jgi:hypothetical protein